MNIFNTLFSIILISIVHSGAVYAGEEWSEKNIQNEISYLAKKLLDMSGKDSYTVNYEAYEKPYIGVCTEISDQGIALTCVTPGSQADKSGLKTGDLVSEMKGITMRNKDVTKTKKSYMKVVHSMKKGDVISMTLLRGDKVKEIEVTVGSMSHPAYTLKIRR